MDRNVAIERAHDALIGRDDARDIQWTDSDASLTFYRRTREDKPIAAWALLFSSVGAQGAVSPDADGGLVAWVHIDATDASLLDILVQPRPSDDLPVLLADDSWPTWLTEETLLFTSGRSRAGHPRWRTRTQAIFLADLAALDLFSVVQAIGESCYNPTVVPHGAVIVFEANGLQSCLLGSGRITSLSSPDRAGSRPSLGPGIVVFSAHRRHGDEDIFAANMSDVSPGLLEQRRLALLDGRSTCPTVLGDGSKVLFAHQSRAREHGEDTPRTPTSSLYVVGAEKPHWENDPPEEVVGGFVNVHRLSVFPDGMRVLVADHNGLWIVDVDARTRTALSLPELYDPDLPGGPPLKMREPAVGPDGNRLAFSGYRDAGDGEDGTGWYIYLCNLDGSDLRRVTPLEDEPVPPYVFPETGKTAFDVAREIALERLNADG